MSKPQMMPMFLNFLSHSNWLTGGHLVLENRMISYSCMQCLCLVLRDGLTNRLQRRQADGSSSLVDCHMWKAFIYFKMANWQPSLFTKMAVFQSVSTQISEMALSIYLQLGIHITSNPLMMPMFQKSCSDSKWPVGGHLCSQICLSVHLLSPRSQRWIKQFT